MNTLLNIMDKLYGDTKMLTIIYVVGAILLLIFVILLIVSLRNPDSKKEENIIEEPKINDEPSEVKEEVVEEPKEEEINESETKVEEEIPEETKESIEETTDVVIEHDADEKETEEKDVTTDTPDVDDFVDDIVNKTYEKNEQFSSVYVGDNTSTVKLDKVLEDLNVDEDVKDAIVPPEEKTIEKDIEVNNASISEVLNKEEDTSVSTPVVDEVPDIEIPSITEEEVNEGLPEEKTDKKTEEIPNSLDSLKAAMDSKKAEIENKQDELKAKLAGLKNNLK